MTAEIRCDLNRGRWTRSWLGAIPGPLGFIEMTIMVALLVVLACKTAVELWLNRINRHEVERWKERPPRSIQWEVDLATYRKSVEYTLAKGRFARLTIPFGGALLGVVAVSGWIPWLDRVICRHLGTGVWAEALYIMVIGVLVSLPQQPLDWWFQFRLEERFGFNRSTQTLWLLDRCKALTISLVLGYPLVCLLVGLIHEVGQGWWVYGFAAVLGFQLALVVLLPKVILPLFNKLAPLPDGPLRDRLLALAERTGFEVSAIQVMDGSKRSTHSNAFFTGLGRFRKIVLLDTLVASMSDEEIAAVLAHEIGHSKKGHVHKGLAVSAAMTLVGFWLVAELVDRPWMYEAFGIESGHVAPVLVLVGLLSGLATFWFTPLANALSRKHEYEADAYALQQMGSPDALVSALDRLAKSNLTNLTPHPTYSLFYYSHPSLIERRAALLGKGGS